MPPKKIISLALLALFFLIIVNSCGEVSRNPSEPLQGDNTIRLTDLKQMRIPSPIEFDITENQISDIGTSQITILILKKETNIGDPMNVPRSIQVLSGSGLMLIGERELKLKQDTLVTLPILPAVIIRPDSGSVLRMLVERQKLQN